MRPRRQASPAASPQGPGGGGSGSNGSDSAGAGEREEGGQGEEQLVCAALLRLTLEGTKDACGAKSHLQVRAGPRGAHACFGAFPSVALLLLGMSHARYTWHTGV